jgi:hypothetical protein
MTKVVHFGIFGKVDIPPNPPEGDLGIILEKNASWRFIIETQHISGIKPHRRAYATHCNHFLWQSRGVLYRLLSSLVRSTIKSPFGDSQHSGKTLTGFMRDVVQSENTGRILVCLSIGLARGKSMWL